MLRGEDDEFMLVCVKSMLQGQAEQRASGEKRGQTETHGQQSQLNEGSPYTLSPELMPSHFLGPHPKLLDIKNDTSSTI